MQIRNAFGDVKLTTGSEKEVILVRGENRIQEGGDQY